MKQVITFGCRLNTYESEIIKDAIESAGAEDIAVFNTCAVTSEAERQARQSIRKYRKEHPDARIVVTGCGAQINPQKYADMPEVNLVLGNEEKLKKENYNQLSVVSSQLSENKEFLTENRQLKTDNFPQVFASPILVSDIMSVRETASHLIGGFEGRSRAFIQVQNGCNHRCTFCIIPYGRGNSRSVPVGEIVGQVKQLIKSGYNEIVLTGVDVSDYGSDLPGKPKLGQMMKRLLNLVPELPRLRLSSIDVAEIDEDLLDLLAHEPRLMPHLHLSLQSGDDMILKRMKRRHSREQVLEFCNKARKLRPDVVFGADIIAGFPTETDEMFENTLNIVKDAGLTYLHIFPYSERKGTPAARMPQLPKKIRKERAFRLREAGQEQLSEFLKRKVGTTSEFVVEDNNFGRSEHFALIKLNGEYSPGQLVKAKAVGSTDTHLIAA